MKAAALNSDLGHTCCIMMLDTKQTSVQKNRCSARTNQPFELKFLGDDLDIANYIPAKFSSYGEFCRERRATIKTLRNSGESGDTELKCRR